LNNNNNNEKKRMSATQDDEQLPSRPYKILAVFGTTVGIVLLFVLPWMIGIPIRWIRHQTDYSITLCWRDGFEFCTALYVGFALLGLLWYVINEYSHVCKNKCRSCKEQWKRHDCKKCFKRGYETLNLDDQDSPSQSSSNSADHFLPSEAFRHNESEIRV